MKQEDAKNKYTKQTCFLQRLVDAYLTKQEREKGEAKKDIQIDFLCRQINKKTQAIPVENIVKVIKDKLKG